MFTFPAPQQPSLSPLHFPTPMDRVASNDIDNQSTMLGSHASAKDIDETPERQAPEPHKTPLQNKC